MLTMYDVRALDGLTDSIAIKDSGGDELVINADGSINVSTTLDSGINEDAPVGDAHAVNLIGLVRQDTLAVDTTADGDASYAKTTNKGELYVSDEDAIALLTTIDADAGAMVTGLAAIEVLLTSIDSDTAAMVVDLAAIEALLTTIDSDTSALSAALKNEDSVAGDAFAGLPILAVRNDVEGSLVGTDGDFGSLQLDSSGRLRVISDIDFSSSVADDAPSTENPILTGGVAHLQSAVLSALSADGDKMHILGDIYRRQFNNDAHNVGWKVDAGTATAIVSQIDSAIKQAGRKSVEIQNLGNETIEVDSASFVFGAGWQIPKKTSQSFKLGEALDVFAICDTGKSAAYRMLQAG